MDQRMQEHRKIPNQNHLFSMDSRILQGTWSNNDDIDAAQLFERLSSLLAAAWRNDESKQQQI